MKHLRTLPVFVQSRLLVEELSDLAFDATTISKNMELFKPDGLDEALDWLELARDLTACLDHVLREGAPRDRRAGGGIGVPP